MPLTGQPICRHACGLQAHVHCLAPHPGPSRQPAGQAWRVRHGQSVGELHALIGGCFRHIRTRVGASHLLSSARLTLAPGPVNELSRKFAEHILAAAGWHCMRQALLQWSGADRDPMLQVTPHQDDERWPAGDYPAQHTGGQGLGKWTKQVRSAAQLEALLPAIVACNTLLLLMLLLLLQLGPGCAAEALVLTCSAAHLSSACRTARSAGRTRWCGTRLACCTTRALRISPSCALP